MRLFSPVRIVNWLSRRPFLSRNRAAIVALESVGNDDGGSKSKAPADCARKSAHRQDGKIRRKVKVSKWKSVSWSISWLDQKMLTSASRLSQKTRGMNEATATFELLDAPRGKRAGRGVEVADAARFAEAVGEVRRREEASGLHCPHSCPFHATRPFAGDTKGRTVTPGV